ncbi:hypothetical protein FGG78_20545 [Thioclava sp. BHET1]|nr:hypothetical protein FGG78_20545 [Thioclava sp. BHET1]
MSAPILQSLTRPPLWGGAERTPAIIVTMFSIGLFAIGCMGQSLILIVLGPLLYLMAMAVLRRVAERDPMAFHLASQWLFQRFDVYRAVRNIDDK